MNTKNIIDLLSQKAGTRPLPQAEVALEFLKDFLVQADIADYLLHCLPHEVVGVSGVRLLPLHIIKMEMVEGAAPGSFIRPYGYLVVATSVGGNAICFHSPSGKVFWADHTSFHPDSISFEDRTTGEWKYFYEYNSENVEKALVLLADNIESFLFDLLRDRLETQLDALD